jgi:hypothetical protein
VALPFRFLPRRAGTVGLALTAYDIWRRLPPQQRKLILASARKHGPRLASAAVERTRRIPPRDPKP